MATPVAHHYYLRGQEHYARTTTEDNEVAVANFKKALELNPRDALSYVGLSLAYTQRAADLNLGRVWLDDAVAAAERAIAIDDKLPEAYRALWVAYNPKLHLGKMREAVRRRVELNPDDAEALRNMGWLLWFTGHADEALPLLKKALELDPTSHWGHFFVGNASLALELYAQAEEFYGRSIQLKPNLSSGHIGMICTYLSQNNEEQAIEQNKRFRANPDEDRYFVKAADVELLLGNVEQARAFAEQGAAYAPDARYYPRGVCASTILGCVLWHDNRAEARRRLEQSIRLNRERLDSGDESSIPRYDLAAANAIQGNKDEACRWLQSAIEVGWRTYRLAMRDPLLLNLRDDQRFQHVTRLVAEEITEARQRMQSADEI